MLPPDLGRKLTGEEDLVLEACRACTVHDPVRRLQCPLEAARRLTERGGRRRPRLGVTRRAAIVAGARGRHGRGRGGDRRVARFAAMPVAIAAPAPAAAARPSPMVTPAGPPADWSETSAVLAEVPERIHCARLLPDGRTIRFVWGTPMRAEDLDTVDPRAPPVAAGGRRLRRGLSRHLARRQAPVYQGHAADGRAFAFLSHHPDGRDGVAVVQTAEPSMASEPTWLADGETFSYDIDAKHMGVFWPAAGRMKVLPDVTTRPIITMFRYVVGAPCLPRDVLTTPARPRSSGSRCRFSTRRSASACRSWRWICDRRGGCWCSRSATAAAASTSRRSTSRRTTRAESGGSPGRSCAIRYRSQMGSPSSACGRRRT